MNNPENQNEHNSGKNQPGADAARPLSEDEQSNIKGGQAVPIPPSLCENYKGSPRYHQCLAASAVCIAKGDKPGTPPYMRCMISQGFS